MRTNYMRLINVITLLVIFVGLMTHPLYVNAKPADFFNQVPSNWLLAKGNNNGISKKEAINIVRQRTNGRILSAKKIQKINVFRVKVLTPNGNIRIIQVDSQTGQIKSK